MERVSISEVKKNFADVLKLVANGKQRIVITDRGKDRAAIIPVEDLELLENLDRDVEVAVERVESAQVKKHLSEDLSLVANGSERIIVLEKKKEIVALVPERDLTLLEQLDERLDIEAARRMLEEKMKRPPAGRSSADDADDDE